MLKIPPKTEYVLKKLTENGFEAYIVGGCVRDMLLGITPYDYDVTTNATPNEVIPLFEKTIPTGLKHGTVTVITKNEPIEVTTFRNESGYIDNRHPESVTFVSSLKEDLARRDFTVNALAYNEACGLKDFFGGKEDLKNRILRAVGNPYERFSEDALRILRLFRFSATLGFEIENDTLKAALSLSKNLSTISRERIASELKKAVAGENPKALKDLILSGGLEFLNIRKCPDFHIIKHCRNSEMLSIFLLFYLSGCDVLKSVADLKLSNSYKAYFKNMLNLLNMPYPQSKAEIKEMLRISSKEVFCDYLKFKSACGIDIKNQGIMLTEVFKYSEPYLISHLNICGKDLEDLGFKGAKIGELLEALRCEVTKNPLKNTREKLLNIIKTL